MSRKVPLTIPDFNGELRMMAVAWSKDKLGAASKPMTVRDPVPALLSLPRFLAPGDKASATLLIDNVDGAAGDYAVALGGKGPVERDSERQALARQSRTGDGAISGDGGRGRCRRRRSQRDGTGRLCVTRNYPIQVRTPYFPVTEIDDASGPAGRERSRSIER